MKWVMRQPFHGGQYEHCYSDIGRGCHNLELFTRIYPANVSDFHQSDNRLDTVHLPANHHRHYAVCRTQKQTPARCLPSHVSKVPLAAVRPVETPGAVAHRNVLSLRHCIEDTFKNTKQSLGSEEPQTWKGQGPERAAVISLWLYSVVWAWYIRYGYRKSSIPIMPWYAAKTHPSFQDALATLRKVLWRKRIIVMFGNHTVPARIIEFFIKAVAAAA